MGCQIEDPEALLADHDVVFVATGRNWPCDQWREGRGFQVAMGRHEEVEFSWALNRLMVLTSWNIRSLEDNYDG